MYLSRVTLNGEEVAKDIAQPGEFPHMCLLFAKEGDKNAYIGKRETTKKF